MALFEYGIGQENSENGDLLAIKMILQFLMCLGMKLKPGNEQHFYEKKALAFLLCIRF